MGIGRKTGYRWRVGCGGIAPEWSLRYVAPGKLISQRPASVEWRTRIGDWEGDLIVDRLTGSAIGTLVDRTFRLVCLVHIPAGHRSEAFAAALIAAIASWRPSEHLTLTWDQGGEMAQHHTVADLFRRGHLLRAAQHAVVAGNQ